MSARWQASKTAEPTIFCVSMLWNFPLGFHSYGILFIAVCPTCFDLAGLQPQIKGCASRKLIHRQTISIHRQPQIKGCDLGFMP